MTTDSAARPPLDGARLSAGNPELMPDLAVEVHDSVPSTNAVAVQRALDGAPDGTVVVADEQTQGRGRLDRQWTTVPGRSLAMSLLLRPTSPTRAWPWLPLLAGYAVDKVLRARGLAAGVKWPNDVLVAERKVAGILVERVETPQGPAAVIGIGVNTAVLADELPTPDATSVDLELGEPVDRTALLIEILNGVREAYHAWELGGDHGGMRLFESYAAACVTVGRRVRAELPGGTVLEGTATGVDPSGQLVIETPDGPRPVSAGDVVHVRTE